MFCKYLCCKPIHGKHTRSHVVRPSVSPCVCASHPDAVSVISTVCTLTNFYRTFATMKLQTHYFCFGVEMSKIKVKSSQNMLKIPFSEVFAISAVCWRIFCEVLCLLHFGIKTNWLSFGDQKVKGQDPTEQSLKGYDTARCVRIKASKKSALILSMESTETTTSCANSLYLRSICQWLSTGVPRNPRVPRASAKGSAAGQ